METLKDKYKYTEPKAIKFQAENEFKPNENEHRSKLLIGIEVELENVSSKANIELPHWKVISDGSLKLKGKEFTIPVLNIHAKQALTLLFNSINYTISNRCSIHIHTNVLQHTEEQLKLAICLYIIFERYLFELSGKRFNSNYCVPLQHHLVKNIKNASSEEFSRLLPKYSALHLFAQNNNQTLGTLEFRHLHGTDNIEEIITWINHVSNLIIFARENRLEPLLNSIYDMRYTSEYLNLFSQVFNYNPIQSNKFKLDIEKGITYLKLLLE